MQRKVAEVQDREQLIQTVREEVERSLCDGVGGFEMEGIMLKQIVLHNRDQPGCKDEHLIQAKD